uniref:Uncharacterized protein n=1 Tax=Siphoviridae sp. ctnpt50 TaxID=2827941 RepID=A0A8S5SDT1_9CAUD|nr:MAG TPA: hypothetical protein [Siphoviridae sp. ctnpt50]
MLHRKGDGKTIEQDSFCSIPRFFQINWLGMDNRWVFLVFRFTFGKVLLLLPEVSSYHPC